MQYLQLASEVEQPFVIPSLSPVTSEYSSRVNSMAENSKVADSAVRRDMQLLQTKLANLDEDALVSDEEDRDDYCTYHELGQRRTSLCLL